MSRHVCYALRIQRTLVRIRIHHIGKFREYVQNAYFYGTWYRGYDISVVFPLFNATH